MGLSGQTVSASNASTSKIRSRLFMILFKYPKFVQPGFSWGLCGFSMALAHLHKFHLMQLIIQRTQTSQVSYITNLRCENIWRTEFNLEFRKHILWWLFVKYIWCFFGLDLVDRLPKLYTKMYCGNCKAGCVKHYTFSPYDAKLDVNLDNSAVN